MCGRVETIGVFGVGKSTLIRMLIEHKMIVSEQCVFENIELIGETIAKGRQEPSAFEMQKMFYAITQKQIAARSSNKPNIFDYSLFGHHHMYSRVLQHLGRLSQSEYNLLEHVFAQTQTNLPPLIGALYLDADITTIQNRLRHRSRSTDQVDLDYIILLQEAAQDLVSSLTVPVLKIDADQTSYPLATITKFLNQLQF